MDHCAIRLERFFHFNIVVADIDVSIPFYESLGFRVQERVSPSGANLAPHLGFSVQSLVAAILVPARAPIEGEQSPMLDLVQFREPPDCGPPYPTLDHVGIGRVAFKIDHFESALARLKALKVRFVGPDVSYRGPKGVMLRTVCFYDPDATVLQIIGEDL